MTGKYIYTKHKDHECDFPNYGEDGDVWECDECSKKSVCVWSGLGMGLVWRKLGRRHLSYWRLKKEDKDER